MIDPRVFFETPRNPRVGFLVGSFWLIATIVTTCSLVLALPLLTSAWRDYRGSRQALDTLALWEHGLDAGRTLAAERGPANGLLGNPLAEQGGWRRRLDLARSATDEALARFDLALTAHPLPEFSELAVRVSGLQQRLADQRARIDALAALAREARSPEAMDQAINGMIALAHPILSLNLTIGQTIGRDGSKLRLMVLVTQLSADLREYAGQLGSRFIVALAYGPEQRARHFEAVDRTEGRILQIHDVMEGRLGGHRSDTELAEARADLVRDYLQDGLAYIRTVRADSLVPDGPPPLSAAEMTEYYVPQMQSIDAMRDLMLSRSKALAAADGESAYAWLMAGCGIVATVFTALGVTSLLAHRHLIQSLVATTREVNELAADRFQSTLPPRQYFGEIRAMIDAIAVLRARNLRRLELEEEREELLRKVRQIAETDHLTGLANRRTFDLVGRRLAESRESVALILCDIDHFKAINDRCGHPCGDAVILEVARRLRETVAGSDIVCRYGGEEFAVILSAAGPDSAACLAECLRAAIAAAPVRVESRDLAVTVSVGFACLTSAESGRSLPDLVSAADAALYRAKQAGRNRVRGPSDSAALEAA